MRESPLAHTRRTPLYRTLEAAQATWVALAETVIAETVGTGQLAPLAIVDLSPLPRLGFKGPGTVAAMQKCGVICEATPNRAFRQADGGLCLVLAPGEVILLSGLKGDGGRLGKMEAAWRLDDAERTYPMPRRDSHAWLAIAGDKAPEMFAKICAIDLRREKFPDLAIAQTSIAKMSAIVTRADRGVHPTFHLLADSAAARYLLNCVLDAAGEFGGRISGRASLEDPNSS